MNEYPVGSYIPESSFTGEGQVLPHALSHYLGARATIYYTPQGISDTGTILYLDNNWIELAKGEERLLIPTRAIRLIKLLEAVPQGEQATYLLRAAGEPTNNKKEIPK